MNDQIRKIEARAWEQVPRTNGLVRTEDFNQKFAELIVAECCDIVGDYYGQSKKSGPGYTMICEIKEHFGVEE